jgi:hypothetical protein
MHQESNLTFSIVGAIKLGASDFDDVHKTL